MEMTQLAHGCHTTNRGDLSKQALNAQGVDLYHKLFVSNSGWAVHNCFPTTFVCLPFCFHGIRHHPDVVFATGWVLL